MSNETFSQETLDQFRKGDPPAFKKAFYHFYENLVWFVYKMIDDKQEAEEIASETLRKLFKKHKHFDTTVKMKAYIYISARNTSINFLRKRQKEQSDQKLLAEKLKNEVRLALEYNTRPELLDIAIAQIEKLPYMCKRVFELLFLEGLKPSEVADSLGISIDNVYNQKKRALKLLRERIQTL